MTNARLTYLLSKFMDRTCTETERAELSALLEKEENKAELEKIMDEGWDLQPAETILDEARADRIFRTIIPLRRFPMRILSGKWHYGIAASLLLLAGWWLYHTLGTENSSALSAGSQTELVKAGNKHHRITLPDGSKVTLNNDSHLEFPNTLQGPVREVYLTGEAYFDIASDPARPFVVRTGKINITVLGTAFNVKAYQEENDITVTVSHGKVKVSTEEETLGTLLPEQQLVIEKNGNHSLLEKADALAAIDWQSQDLFFDDVSMAEAALVLEDRFAKKFVFQNKDIADCRFSANFLNRENLPQILDALCAFNNAMYAVRDENVYISGEGCESDR